MRSCMEVPSTGTEKSPGLLGWKHKSLLLSMQGFPLASQAHFLKAEPLMAFMNLQPV